MFLPLLVAAATVISSPDQGTAQESPSLKVMTVRIPMPKFISPDEQLKFDIPYQIPELNWGNQRFWNPYESQRDNTKNWLDSDYALSLIHI